MNIQTTAFRSMDDLVFEKRNVSYGAYILRKNYSKNLFSASAISITFFAIVLLGPGFFPTEIVEKELVKPIQGPFIQPPPLIKTVLDIKPPAGIPPAAPNTNVVPVVGSQDNDVDLFVNKNIQPPSVDGPETGGNIDPGVFGGEVIDAVPVITKVDTFITVENMPEFSGDLSKFLQKNLRYPELPLKQNIGGKVYLSFVIGTDGSIGNVQVLKGVTKELDDEAIRVVKKMPNWKPGKQSGKPVPVRFSLPIIFKLE